MGSAADTANEAFAKGVDMLLPGWGVIAGGLGGLTGIGALIARMSANVAAARAAHAAENKGYTDAMTDIANRQLPPIVKETPVV